MLYAFAGQPFSKQLQAKHAPQHVASSSRATLTFKCRVDRCQASIFVSSSHIHFFPSPRRQLKQTSTVRGLIYITDTFLLYATPSLSTEEDIVLFLTRCMPREIISVATIAETSNKKTSHFTLNLHRSLTCRNWGEARSPKGQAYVYFLCVGLSPSEQ